MKLSANMWSYSARVFACHVLAIALVCILTGCPEPESEPIDSGISDEGFEHPARAIQINLKAAGGEQR